MVLSELQQLRKNDKKENTELLEELGEVKAYYNQKITL